MGCNLSNQEVLGLYKYLFWCCCFFFCCCSFCFCFFVRKQWRLSNEPENPYQSWKTAVSSTRSASVVLMKPYCIFIKPKKWNQGQRCWWDKHYQASAQHSFSKTHRSRSARHVNPVTHLPRPFVCVFGVRDGSHRSGHEDVLQLEIMCSPEIVYWTESAATIITIVSFLLPHTSFLTFLFFLPCTWLWLSFPTHRHCTPPPTLQIYVLFLFVVLHSNRNNNGLYLVQETS